MRNNSRGHGRRRSGALRGRIVPHVFALRGGAEVESGNIGEFAEFAGWPKASGRLDSGTESLLEAEVRERGASRAARSRHRAARPRSHFGGDGGGAARGRRN